MNKKTYNEDYFKNIDNEEKAYFLGLICSDGSITYNENKYRYQISIKLHNKDEYILDEFIKSINGTMNV